jgi:hypothetical protein
VLTCEDDESGMFEAAQVQQKIFKQSMVEDIELAEIFQPCEDRAGNVNDLSDFGDELVLIDLQNPTCSVEPSNLQFSANGNAEDVHMMVHLADNFDENPEFSLKSLVSSDGGGSAVLTDLHKDDDLTGHVHIDFLRTKSGPLRTYTATFEVEDESGRTGTCSMKVKIK